MSASKMTSGKSPLKKTQSPFKMPSSKGYEQYLPSQYRPSDRPRSRQTYNKLIQYAQEHFSNNPDLFNKTTIGEERVLYIQDGESIGTLLTLKRLENGSFGDVYVVASGFDMNYKENETIIKIQRSGLSFENEMKILNYLKSIHLTPELFCLPLHYGTVDGRDAIVFPRYDYTLNHFLLKFANIINDTHLKRIDDGITDALTELHSRNIIHCDVKPDNIFLNYDEKSQTITKIVLGDFGAAINMNEPNAIHRIIGSPYYLSPMAVNMKVSPMNDWWSYACIIFNIMTLYRKIVTREDGSQEESYQYLQLFHISKKEYHDEATVQAVIKEKIPLIYKYICHYILNQATDTEVQKNIKYTLAEKILYKNNIQGEICNSIYDCIYTVPSSDAFVTNQKIIRGIIEWKFMTITEEDVHLSAMMEKMFVKAYNIFIEFSNCRKTSVRLGDSGMSGGKNATIIDFPEILNILKEDTAVYNALVEENTNSRTPSTGEGGRKQGLKGKQTKRG